MSTDSLPELALVSRCRPILRASSTRSTKQMLQTLHLDAILSLLQVGVLLHRLVFMLNGHADPRPKYAYSGHLVRDVSTRASSIVCCPLSTPWTCTSCLFLRDYFCNLAVLSPMASEGRGNLLICTRVPL